MSSLTTIITAITEQLSADILSAWPEVATVTRGSWLLESEPGRAVIGLDSAPTGFNSPYSAGRKPGGELNFRLSALFDEPSDPQNDGWTLALGKYEAIRVLVEAGAVYAGEGIMPHCSELILSTVAPEQHSTKNYWRVTVVVTMGIQRDWGS